MRTGADCLVWRKSGLYRYLIHFRTTLLCKIARRQAFACKHRTSVYRQYAALTVHGSRSQNSTYNSPRQRMYEAGACARSSALSGVHRCWKLKGPRSAYKRLCQQMATKVKQPDQLQFNGSVNALLPGSSLQALTWSLQVVHYAFITPFALRSV